MAILLHCPLETEVFTGYNRQKCILLVFLFCSALWDFFFLGSEPFSTPERFFVIETALKMADSLIRALTTELRS